MVSIFRSENVEFCQVIIPNECSYSVIRRIGELECMEFLDRNEDIPAFSRKFTGNILWCDEIERKLRYLEECLNEENMKSHNEFVESIEAPNQNEFNELENEIDGSVNQIKQSNSHLEDLKKGYNELTEFRDVLRNVEKLDSSYGSEERKNINVIYGVIAQSRVNRFEQFLWRTSRGNIFFKQIVIEEDYKRITSNEIIPKCVFVIYLQGDKLVQKVKKVCEAFDAHTYIAPPTSEEKSQTFAGLLTRIKDVELVIFQTIEQRRVLFNNVCKNLQIWYAKILKIKSIFTILNLFSYDNGSRTLVAEAWCPTIYIEQVKIALINVQAVENTDLPTILNVVRTNKEPPTFYQLNKVSSEFQNLVDAYGVSAYKEVNPSIFMTITFPFLFSVMFGDFAHALFIVIFGLWLVIKEKDLFKYRNDEMFGMIYYGRYIILLMGLFSLYSGFIYNDYFSKSIYLFPSSWNLPSDKSGGIKLDDVKKLKLIDPQTPIYLDPGNFSRDYPYPFGLDPIWQFANNKISFLNSFKMKASVILGFFQMLFGIILSAVNQNYFHHSFDFFTQFIPQLLFFVSIFGYLVFMIIYKWIFFKASDQSAPSILLTLINMFINIIHPIPPSDQLYYGQKIVEVILVIIAVLCVPWMLCVKPIYLIFFKSSRNFTSFTPQADSATHLPLSDNESSTVHYESPSSSEHKGAGEICIMQLIHTIEFCLGCISNTASYLRLWALSLAHNQLSELLWNMVLRNGLQVNSYLGSITIFIAFGIFLIFTFVILVIMEGLSTFLHAIRLHWVEFQNKFYAGTGKPLNVYSLKKIVENNIN